MKSSLDAVYRLSLRFNPRTVFKLESSRAFLSFLSALAGFRFAGTMLISNNQYLSAERAGPCSLTFHLSTPFSSTNVIFKKGNGYQANAKKENDHSQELQPSRCVVWILGICVCIKGEIHAGQWSRLEGKATTEHSCRDWMAPCLPKITSRIPLWQWNPIMTPPALKNQYPKRPKKGQSTWGRFFLKRLD